jgi:hypothetical protein
LSKYFGFSLFVDDFESNLKDFFSCLRFHRAEDAIFTWVSAFGIFEIGNHLDFVVGGSLIMTIRVV